MSSSNLPYKQVKNVERRTWDKESYLEKAQERANKASTTSNQNDSLRSNKRPLSTDALNLIDYEEKEEFVPALPGSSGPAKSKRAFLKSRRQKVDLESKLGSVEIINPENAASSSSKSINSGSIKDGVTKSPTGVGWYCSVCDCWLRDSITYVDHINGKKHQRYLGYSMRIEKSTNEQVRNKLAELAKAKLGAISSSYNYRRGQNSYEADYDEHIKDNIVEASSQEKINNNDQQKDNASQDGSPTERQAVAIERKEEETVADEDEDDDDNNGDSQNIAAIMGFSGFK